MDQPVRRFAVGLGIAYIAVGVIGFAFTGFSGWLENGDDAILFFEVNPFHNLFHIITGSLWLLATQLPKDESIEGVHQGIGIVYLAAVLLGGLGWLTMLSIDGIAAPDNLLHGATAVAALVAAFSQRRRPVATATG